MTASRPYRIIISGGGTGGHVFPAIAIADALKRIDQRTEILFVGAKGKLEMEKVPAAGYRIEGLDIAGIQRRMTTKNISFPMKLMRSLSKSRRIVKSFMPDAAVGVGGYASGPVLFIAARRGVPTVLQEQNSYAGKTNKWLSRRARKICVAYDNMERYFPADRIVNTGNPVRSSLANITVNRQEALLSFRLSAERKTLLVLGGSLGARTINESISGGLQALLDAGHQVIWQCGRFYLKEFETLARHDVVIHAFIEDMGKAYAAADVVVARAGALTISELCLVGKPAILVPSPHVAEDHQRKNAMALVEKGAAEMILDSEARQRLVPAVLSLMNNDSRQATLSQGIRALAKPNAADDIAREIMALARSHTPNAN
jgi:UDP-N-acetylglucosamine--N-acetylmuramyl-(pentapeptide) pyrophosphoryl-undecaprenol N-acetylglucosamine transferase